MAENFQGSFIPKKAVSGSAPEKRSSGGVGVLRASAVIVFVIVIALAVGVFLYEQLLERSIVRKEEALARAREAFEPELIEELARLDERIDSAQQLTREHLAPTKLFTLLENLTLQTVRFTSLTYTARGEGGHTLRLDGEGQSFASVALQSDEFGNSQFIVEPVVGDLALNQFGRVNFTVAAQVDPSLLVYTPNTISQPSSIPDGVSESLEDGEGEVTDTQEDETLSEEPVTTQE